MSKAKQKREKIFNMYAQNLSWIKENPKITFKPDFAEGYICPLCLQIFTRDSLNASLTNHLSIEHNPPRSLGGKSEILTCKECNSKAGHQLDNHLLNQLLALDFMEGNPHSAIRARLNSDVYQVTSNLTITSDGTYHINIDSKNSHPAHVKNFLQNRSYSFIVTDHFLNNEKQQLGTNWNLKFSLFPHILPNERFSAISLLKIAYLITFQVFGYIFIINPHLCKVREQIRNPEKDILPKVFWLKYDFPDEALGINIINRPAELVCILVVFDLVTPSSNRRFAIALPGLNKSANQIYEHIENILCKEGGATELNLEHIPAGNYIKKKESAYELIHYWQQLVPLENKSCP